MKIEEAIEELCHIAGPVKIGDPTEQQKAIIMGIEALKRIHEARKHRMVVLKGLLHGETNPND